ncbi:hypothetical protein L1887_31411 [Cichorium endivia]|nr:hypothetical protein L1887_31411 [Cichorium endivia]
MVATGFFSRRSSKTFMAFFMVSFELHEPSRTAMNSTIRRAARLSCVVILLNGNSLLEYDDNATIDSRSLDESDETMDFIAVLIICNFSHVILPLTSTTVTKLIGALRCVFSGALELLLSEQSRMSELMLERISLPSTLISELLHVLGKRDVSSFPATKFSRKGGPSTSYSFFSAAKFMD